MGRRPIGKTAMSGAERIRRWRERHPKKPTPEKAGIAAALLRARVHELEGELARERQRRKDAEGRMLGQAQAFRDERARHKPEAARPPLPPDEARDRRIKSLATENKNLKAKLAYFKQWYEAGLATAGGMSFETQSAIAKALHSDRQPSETDQANALKLFNAWKANKDKARRKAKL
jgi:hypothetical protein